MDIIIFLFLIGMITMFQGAMPFLLKKTVVFGVTIPDPYTDEKDFQQMKKAYAGIVFALGILFMAAYYFLTRLSGNLILSAGITLPFALLFLSMALYFYFHAKTTKLKKTKRLGEGLKQVRVTDLNIRTRDEMLPSYLFLIPFAIGIGLIAFTATQYSRLPDPIPTHWGIDGKPDAFSPKNPMSVLALPLILLIMQAMFLGINVATNQSGIKLNAAKRKTSAVQQLSFRKYTSWLLYGVSILVTFLFTFLQLTTIYPDFAGEASMIGLPLAFTLAVLVATGVYAFKIGQSGSRLEVEVVDEPAEGVTEVDDDRYWKGGLFYVNKNDPSIFVEKRFGVGWSLNYANPIGYLVLIVPVAIILWIAFLYL